MSTAIINTDSFHKFITTISLVASVYFFSFHTTFLTPYNERANKINMEICSLSAQKHLTEGLIIDLNSECGDHIHNYAKYTLINKEIHFDTFRYYYNFPKDSIYSPKIDSLNKLQNKLALVSFVSTTLQADRDVLTENITTQEIGYYVMGSFTTILFLIFSVKWFLNEKKNKELNSIDKSKK